MTPDKARQKAWEILNEFVCCSDLTDAQCQHASTLVDLFTAALLEAAGEWQPIETAPRDRWILLYDERLQRCVVAQWMTPMEDGLGDWVLARRLGSDGMAFISDHATHWRDLPTPPDVGFSGCGGGGLGTDIGRLGLWGSSGCGEVR